MYTSRQHSPQAALDRNGPSLESAGAQVIALQTLDTSLLEPFKRRSLNLALHESCQFDFDFEYPTGSVGI